MAADKWVPGMKDGGDGMNAALAELDESLRPPPMEAGRAPAADGAEAPAGTGLLDAMLALLIVTPEKIAAYSSLLNSLTPRESEVCGRILKGMTAKEIARELDLSPKTIEHYRAIIFRKLNVKTPAEIMKMIFVVAVSGNGGA